MEADYKVKLEVFEGPLDLLLYLIKQDEIDIYDISLERITGQYHATRKGLLGSQEIEAAIGIGGCHWWPILTKVK